MVDIATISLLHYIPFSVVIPKEPGKNKNRLFESRLGFAIIE